MARTYTKRRIEEANVISPDDFNDENRAIAEQVNRNLDGHNIPVQQVSATKLVDAAYSSDGSFAKSRGVFQDFYTYYTAGADWTTPNATISLRTGTTEGWTSMYDGSILLTGSVIDFTNLREGVLRGTAVIDFERRYGFNSAAFTQREGHQQSTRFGVFFDEQLIMDSGDIYNRRFTVVLPFMTPTSSGAHRLELKFRFISEAIDTTNSRYAQTLNFYAVGMSIQNKVR